MSLPPLFADRVMETSTTTGTGAYTLAGAVTGFQAFSAGIGDGVQCYYCAFDVDSNGNPTANGWEVGEGVYTLSGTTLTRGTILASSNSGAAVSWGAGTRRIFVTLPAAAVPSLDPVIGVAVSRAKYVQANGSNLAIGDHDLYTVPTGRRAIVVAVQAYNNSGGTIAWFLETKISGTYYRLTTNQNISSATGSAAVGSAMLSLFEAGETISVNVATTNGLNVFPVIVEFDATSPLKQGRILGPSSGNNTLYTCPTGKTAILVGTGSSSGLAWGANLVAPIFVADSGAARTIVINLVPSGNSPGTANQAIAGTSVSASQRNAFGGLNATPCLSAGDFVNLNVDVGNAAQYASAIVLER